MKKNHKNQAINLLKEIFKAFPTQNISTHLSLALSEYQNFDGISDKEFCHILEKYKVERELDIESPKTESALDKLMKDAMNIGDPSYLIDDEEDF